MRVLKGLLSCREERMLSQNELARTAGVTQTTISLLERELRPAAPVTVRKLAKALRVRPRQLYGED